MRVKLEGLSAHRWAQFESIKFSLFIHLLHMDKTETLQNQSIFVTAQLPEHALRIKGALNIHKCALTVDDPS